MQEISSRSALVSAKGGNLDFLSSDGELLFSVFVPAGRYSARDYLDLVPSGGTVEASDGLVVVNPRLSVSMQDASSVYESGANPDFKPTSATRLEAEMRQTIGRMQAVTSRLEARDKALSAVDRVPRSDSKAGKSDKYDPAAVTEAPAASV